MYYIHHAIHLVITRHNVERENSKLILNRDIVRRKVEATDYNIEEVSEVVFEWLKEAEILIHEAENPKIKGSSRKERRHMYFDELLRKITALNKRCVFKLFSTPIPSLEHFSNGNIVSFRSTVEASNDLLQALEDDDRSIIGLYGRKGSGKTTLVKAMAEKVKFLNSFHVVLFATVTQKPNIRTMQDEITDSLNIKFDKNSESGRARRILDTIENMDHRILVIFDDVQAKFDPNDVGIPCNSNRCKILLTIRREQDFNFMNLHRDLSPFDPEEMIHLGPLFIEEAWTLFKKHFNDDEYSSSFDLLNVAREVALECEGLPGIIKDVGSSLRN